jgi:hypothetical protein
MKTAEPSAKRVGQGLTWTVSALVHQYLIPGVQIGSNVPVDKVSGEVGDVFAVCRPVSPDLGCLWCSGVISAARLQEEAASSKEQRAWAYGRLWHSRRARGDPCSSSDALTSSGCARCRKLAWSCSFVEWRGSGRGGERLGCFSSSRAAIPPLVDLKALDL